MLERGRYGVEWTPHSKDRESSGLGRIVGVVILLALVSLGWTVWQRLSERRAETTAETPVTPPPAVPPPVAPSSAAPPTVTIRTSETFRTSLPRRSPRLRNLLLRLDEAEKLHDSEMAVTTIETIRALPGSPAADIDDALARRLGTLNIRRLFIEKNAQWVTKVTVKSGSSASRIAAEHGSTLASLAQLNGGNVERIRVGQELSVMNHPRFNLVVHRRARAADLQLNGKFFKRYDMIGTSDLEDGAFEWREPRLGAAFKMDDRNELNMLLPKSTSVLVSEM